MSEAHRTSRYNNSGVLRSENNLAMGLQLRHAFGWQEQVYNRGLDIRGICALLICFNNDLYSNTHQSLSSLVHVQRHIQPDGD